MIMQSLPTLVTSSGAEADEDEYGHLAEESA